MGVEDYLLTSTVNGILAQRLVRRLDLPNAQPFEAMPEVIREYELERFTDERPIRLYKPGASPTNPTGYFGRTTIMSPFDIYQVDLVVSWGGRAGAQPRTAHFGTLRAVNPDPNRPQGASAGMSMRTGGRQ